MSIALIDYGAGNLTSVRKALRTLGAKVTTPSVPEALTGATGIVVPGVGHFGATRALAVEWLPAVRQAVDDGTPMLGICLGMQWLFDGSLEAPDVPGLGVIGGQCTPLDDIGPDGPVKVPHVGWNRLTFSSPSWLLRGVDDGAYVYFTHSYAPPITPACVAVTEHANRFASVVERDHVGGVQFHPEKSGQVGLTILGNFLRRTGAPCSPSA